MTHRRRVARLEGADSAVAAVTLWLADAQEHQTIGEYAQERAAHRLEHPLAEIRRHIVEAVPPRSFGRLTTADRQELRTKLDDADVLNELCEAGGVNSHLTDGPAVWSNSYKLTVVHRRGSKDEMVASTGSSRRRRRMRTVGRGHSARAFRGRRAMANPARQDAGSPYLISRFWASSIRLRN